jgi:hypothetical protein
MKSKLITAFALPAVFLVLFLGSAQDALAATVTSNGTGGGDWGIGATWSGGSVPGNNDTVIIASGDTVTISANRQAGVVTINSGGTIRFTANATLQINSASTFTINGTLDLGSVTSDIKANNVAVTLSTGANGLIQIASSRLLDSGGAGFVFTLNMAGSSWDLTSLGTSGTVEYNGGTQTVTSTTFFNLHCTGSGTKSPGGIVTVNGTFTVDTGVTFSTANSFNAAGNWVMNGTFTQTAGTTTFTGGGTHTLSGSGSSQFAALTTSSQTINAGASDLRITGNWTHGTAGIFNEQTSTVTFNGSGNQTQPTTSFVPQFYNLTINKSGGNLSSSRVWTVTNNFQLTNGTIAPANGSSFNNYTMSGGTFTAPSGTVSITGNFTNNGGTFTAGTGTVQFNGSSAQTIGGSSSTAFSGLTINNSAGVSLNTAGSVSGVLTLTTDLTATATLTQSGTSAGTGDVVGTVSRSDIGTTTRAFGNPFVQITRDSGTLTQLSITLAKGSTPTHLATGVRRQYTLTPGAGTFNATVQLHYLDSELNGNAEGTLELYRSADGGLTFASQGASARDATDNWVRQTGITTFSPWGIAGPNAPTAIQMAGYAANRFGKGKVLLEWETGYEVDNLGFNIYRQQGGDRVRINKSLIAGSALFAAPGTRLTAGRSYIWRDKLPEGSDAYYWLEEIDLTGRSLWHGPIFVGEDPPHKSKLQLTSNEVPDAITIEQMNSEAADQGPTLPVEEAAHLRMVPSKGLMAKESVGATALSWTLGSQAAVKLSVKREGWYRASAAELQAAGLAPNADPKRLQLWVDGQEVPIKVLSTKNTLTAIEFYGVGLDTPSTDSHTYWLIVGAQNGKRISTTSGTGSATPAASFQYTVERRDRSIYLSGIRNGEAENFFGAVVVSNPVNQVVNLSRVDTGASGQATVEVAMQGLSLLSHYVMVWLNGSYLGAVEFTGPANGSATFTVPMSSLLEGANTFTLRGQTTVLDVSLVDRIRVTYWRTYTADGNLLKLTANGGEKVTIGGFTSTGVRVVDVTDPLAPQELQLAGPSGNGVSSEVAFSVPGLGSRTLLAFASDQVRAVAGASANNKSNLRNTNTQADLVIITHASLVDSFRPLQSFRQGQGLKVAMVDIEDVYDEFSYGNKTPQAVREFLSYAKTSWKQAPKYVLLAGGASFDPKNYVGQGANDLVPTKLVDTQFMETASDDWFSDFNNDALAEMAVGRLPANNPSEADTMVSKIIAYETSAGSNSVTLTADQNDDFSFEGASAQLKPLVPPGIGVAEIDRGQLGTTLAKQQLLNAIAAGQKIVNYTGHGSSRQWRSGFFTSDDARALANGSHLPLFVMMTCLNGLFQDVNLDGLAPALMKSANGGAIAVWASSGLTEPAEQSVMNRQLYTLLFPSGGVAPNLGDATMKAKAAVTDPDIRRTWILFGDPTTRLK